MKMQNEKKVGVGSSLRRGGGGRRIEVIAKMQEKSRRVRR